VTKPVWFPAGDRGLLLDLTGYAAQLDGLPPPEKRQTLTRQARRLGTLIKAEHNQTVAGITDIVPGLASLLIHYDPARISAQTIKSSVSLLLDRLDENIPLPARHWHLPVCYDDAAAPDLGDVAARCGLSPQEVIDIHCGTELEVAIMGFLPGLAYMTGLDSRLNLPRRSEPRIAVPGGSVAIAMDQTVIYPLDSPGGWNLIGLMPVPLFDSQRSEPVLLKAGDRISFYAVSRSDYDQIAAACKDGRLAVQPTQETAENG